ncbi:LysR family transcriptional regulator [Solicola gregarius]|uniref:LysR family transcriptional regulator n=1 Tax=Solicola gregarius TaxID=2908642 RepID=A0AA46YJ58_9ACTN|nr:LysR family transcriptional regulator [Solicola gregarius]UYM04140.1 LysR family transcriptional regulator [Solicola gregarius]
MTPFTLTQLRYFAAVAEADSMTAAARELMITQSALSTAMSQLEKALGVQLFMRQGTRALRLTAAGAQFVRDLTVFLEHADSLYEAAQGLAKSPVGVLSVGVFGPLASVRLPLILDELERRYPGLEVTIHESDLADQQDALRSGRCEIALTYGLGLARGFTAQALQRIPPHVIVSREHRLARRPERPVHLRALEDDPLILLDLPHSREYYESLFRLVGVTPNVRHRLVGYETVRSFVARGHGYALLNQRLQHDLTYTGDSVVPIQIADELPPIELMLVRPSDVRPTRRALAFEEVCRTLYGET